MTTLPKSFRQETSQEKLAGIIFGTCRKLLLILAPIHAFSRSDTNACLRVEAQRFCLWGDDVGALEGKLDRVAEVSDPMKDTVLSLLSGLAETLMRLAARESP
jgi:hypothetical protein